MSNWGGKADAHAEHLRSQRAVAAEKAEEACRRCGRGQSWKSEEPSPNLEVRAQIRAKQQGGALGPCGFFGFMVQGVRQLASVPWQMQTRKYPSPNEALSRGYCEISRAGPSNSAAAEALVSCHSLGGLGKLSMPYSYELDSCCPPACWFQVSSLRVPVRLLLCIPRSQLRNAMTKRSYDQPAHGTSWRAAGVVPVLGRGAGDGWGWH